MKKALSLALALILCMNICACQSSTSNQSETQNEYADPIATVVNNNGEAENLTASDIRKISHQNEVAFKNKYFGAKVTVIGEVEEVMSTTTINGITIEAGVSLKGGWEIEASKEEVMNLMPGDIVKATGQIFWATFDVSLYRINGWETTVQPYND